MTAFQKFGFAMAATAVIGIGTAAVAQKAAVLPKDVDPDSRNRLPMITMEDLDDFGRTIFTMQASGKTAADSGPRSIRMYSPRVSEYMTRGNTYLRYESGMDPKLRELTILLAARAYDQQYEWTAHETTARKEGLPQSVIDIVKQGKPVAGVTDEKQAILITLGREVLYDHQVSADTFAAALKLFGKKGLVDHVSLLGHYAATAILLTVFDQQIREGDTPLLHPVKAGRPATE